HRAKNGQPLLSWRVIILPYLEASPLYSQILLDEPWDSRHNKLLLAQDATCFSTLRAPGQAALTCFHVFEGKGTVIEGKPLSLADISAADGLATTILFVEAGQP